MAKATIKAEKTDVKTAATTAKAKATTAKAEATTAETKAATAEAETTTISKQAELRAKLEGLVKKWNESAEFSEYRQMTKISEQIADVVQEYKTEAERECFYQLKKSDNIMVEAAKTLSFEIVTVKDKKEEDKGGKITKEVCDSTCLIDPLRLHRCTNDGIGADKHWNVKVERLNMLLTAATASEIEAVDKSGVKLDSETINKTHTMTKDARDITLKNENDPSNDDNMLENVQMVINAMLGEGYTATPSMVRYLRKTHEKGGRGSMTLVCTRPKSMRQYMLDVCHSAITGEKFILDYKKAKK